MRLTKHQGLGNDFLVLIDLDGPATDLADLARAACDRHLGVGADGLLHVRAPEDVSGRADVVMALYNADGGRAEISGNGLACLAQAVVVAGVAGPDRVDVVTDAGRRTVAVLGRDSPRRHRMRVEMGRAIVVDGFSWRAEDGVLAAASVDVGNPHVVLHVAEPAKFPIEDVGERICSETSEGANVEAVAPTADGGLTMVVYERGVGLTQACGSGACAAAVAAAGWGLVPDCVRVAMPGGVAEVAVAEGTSVSLTTDVVHVATLDFHWP
jgi:diaminopimelate epimerase